MNAAAERLVGRPVRRVEDRRLLTGRGRFLDNIALPGMLHGAFVRSVYPHATLCAVDVRAAREAPGVAAVLTAQDLAGVVASISFDVPAGFLAASQYPALAVGKVRYVGDPIALVVASSRAAAEDAAELVVVDYDPLPGTGTIEQALADEHPPVWDEAGTNIVFSTSQQFGDPDDAFRRADRVVSARLRQHRVTNAPMEPRGLIATFDPARRELLCHMATQAPQNLRLSLARMAGLPASSVRVVNGDIGGSFGQKAWVRHEDVAVVAATLLLGRPVKWIEDRSENLATGGQARDEYADVEMAVTGDGAILGVRLALYLDQGAFTIPGNNRAVTVAIIRTLFPSAYRLEHFDYSATIVTTNKASYTAYRGPWAAETWLRERMVDLVADELGIEPLELRRRNLWRDDELPRTMVTGPTLADLTVRSSLDRLAAHPLYAGFRERQVAARAEGRYLGLGVAAFMEPAPGPPDFFPAVLGIVLPPGVKLARQPARVRMEPDGSVWVAIMQGPGGQGHETTYAQILADAIGAPLDTIRVLTGDSAQMEPGSIHGTAGSGSAHMAGGAVQGAGRALAARLRQIAAHLLEASEADIDLSEGTAFVRGTPAKSMSFAQLASMAWNMPFMLPPDIEPGLEILHEHASEDCGWSQAVHCCGVEVDPRTGVVTVTDYVVFEDCGEVINPAIVDGQVRGGVVQGIGTVLFERIVYDEGANLLTSSFVDYLLPTATDIPFIEVNHVGGSDPTPVNFRGVGEGGAIAAPAAVCNAVSDALSDLGIRITQLDLSPAVVRELVRNVYGQREAREEP